MIQSETGSSQINDELADKEKELRELDDQMSNLNDEISRLSRQGDTRTKLSLKKSDHDSKVASIDTLYEACNDEIKSLLGRVPDMDNLDGALTKALA